MSFKWNQQKLIFALITAVLLLGLIILAGALSQLELSEGETFNLLALLRSRSNPVTLTTLPVTTAVINIIFKFLMILFQVGFVGAVIYVFISPKYRRRVLRATLMVALLLFLYDQLAYRLQEEQREGLAAVMAPLESTSSSLPQPPTYVTDPPAWISWVVSGTVVLLLVILYTVWRRRLQPDPQQMVVQEAERALQELDTGGDVKDVVLRCYLQMEGVMRQSQDIKRRQSMTPREFEQRLAAAGFRDEHIGRLVRLFENVRYSERPSDGRAEREARDCLSAIVASYG